MLKLLDCIGVEQNKQKKEDTKIILILESEYVMHAFFPFRMIL